MKLRDLFVRIGFDVDSKPIKDLDAGIKDLKSSILAISGVTVAAAGALLALVKTTANAGSDAKKMSQSLGLAVETFQELEYAASLSEVSTEEFQVAMRQLSNSAHDASMGMQTYARAYKILGISVTGANGKLKDSDQLLAEIADKFSRMPDSLEKTALANDLFGRSGAFLIPLLNKGSAGIADLRQEARDLGVVMSIEDVEAADEFGNSVTRLMATIRGIKNQIGLGLLPVLTEVIRKVQEWIIANRQLIRSVMADWVKRLAGFIKVMYSIIKGAVDAVIDLAEAFGGLNRVLVITSILMATFIGLKTLYSIGLIIRAVYGLATAFWSLTAAQMASKAAAVAWPVLIGAAFVALGLILEDIIAYFQGRKSITGLLIEAFEKRFPTAFNATRKVLEFFRDGLLGIWEIIKGFALAFAGLAHFDLGAIKAGLNQVWQVFADSFAAIGKTIKDAFITAFDFISGTSAFKVVAGLIGKAWDFVQWGGGAIMAPFTSSPANAPVSSPSSISNVNAPQSISVNAPVSINVPPGTPPEEVGSRVQAGVSDGIDRVVRQAYWALKPQTEW